VSQFTQQVFQVIVELQRRSPLPLYSILAHLVLDTSQVGGVVSKASTAHCD
jgi:hypothetical protein